MVPLLRFVLFFGTILRPSRTLRPSGLVGVFSHDVVKQLSSVFVQKKFLISCFFLCFLVSPPLSLPHKKEKQNWLPIAATFTMSTDRFLYFLAIQSDGVKRSQIPIPNSFLLFFAFSFFALFRRNRVKSGCW